ncbi:L-glutamine-phosphate cytidylyltransferase [Clostridium neonatale]|uniref:phosphocholine cytidylyltransferase family protein n=1 Tax=Clostridium TaxID=1485 RepID=UPI002907D8D6|nr:phosphocholine cytidylyltransferase family protein [Clostridium sp.]MDU4478594.1 phosphocholine cytidylyltransferase family protein [Clostridium sp.]CAI3672930.1 L-glutamine-phosphate cytidylyltransferase [Clostridium neonatale]
MDINAKKIKMIILAAGKGTRLRPLTDDIPKCLVKVKGKSLIDWQIEVAKRVGIDDIIVIRGYEKEKLEYLKEKNIKLIDNLDYDTTNMVETLFKAREYFDKDIIISYGDIIYEEKVLKKLVESRHSISVVVDHGWEKYWKMRCDNIYSDAESLVLNDKGCIINIGQKVNTIDFIQGQYIGLSKFDQSGIKKLIKIYEKEKEAFQNGKNYICKTRNIKQIYMTDIIEKIIDENIEVYEVPINRGWIEIDTIKDLEIAEKIISNQWK